MSIIFRLLRTLLSLYELVLLAYVIMSWIRIPSNQLTEFVRSLVEPVLRPIRRVLNRWIPIRWQIIDWSVLALWLILGFIGRIL